MDRYHNPAFFQKVKGNGFRFLRHRLPQYLPQCINRLAVHTVYRHSYVHTYYTNTHMLCLVHILIRFGTFSKTLLGTFHDTKKKEEFQMEPNKQRPGDLEQMET